MRASAPILRSSSIENDTKWKICSEHFGRRTHLVLIIVNSRALPPPSPPFINKADWWHSNMVEGSIVYWFKSRFLHITFRFFFAVFFRIDFASLLIYLYSAVDGAFCSYSNRLSLSVSWGDIIEQTTAAAASTENRWAIEERKNECGHSVVMFRSPCENEIEIDCIVFYLQQFGNGWRMQRWAMSQEEKMAYTNGWEWEWERVVLASKI